jgi:hypothetical protein
MSDQATLPTDHDGHTGDHEAPAEWRPPEGGIDTPNYDAIPLPDPLEKPRGKWTSRERRKELLEEIREAGHADNLPKSQRQYGNMYGVSQQMIHKDIQELRKYIRQTSGAEAIEDTEAIKHKAVMDALDNEDYGRAFELQLKYNDFMFELGRYDKAPDRKQVQSLNVDADASEGLTDEQMDHFDQFSEMLQNASGGSGEAIDVEARDVDTEPEEGDE